MPRRVELRLQAVESRLIPARFDEFGCEFRRGVKLFLQEANGLHFSFLTTRGVDQSTYVRELSHSHAFSVPQLRAGKREGRVIRYLGEIAGCVPPLHRHFCH